VRLLVDCGRAEIVDVIKKKAVLVWQHGNVS
jgi:hypothetical protein